MNNKVLNENALNEWKKFDPENGTEIFSQILIEFNTSAITQHQKFCEAWTSNNIEAVRRTAHSLKSSCGNVGADWAHHLFDKIENAIDSKQILTQQDFESATHAFMETVRAIKQLQDRLGLLAPLKAA